jgi:hypothetical protein
LVVSNCVGALIGGEQLCRCFDSAYGTQG